MTAVVAVVVAAGSSEFAWRPLRKIYTVVAMVVDGRDVTEIACEPQFIA